MADKVAVVTGSNKGIGYGIVRKLCKRGVGHVYLTARDVKRGHEAVENLNKEGFKPYFHQLEVTDENSVKAFTAHLKQKHGGLDILINNAGLITSNFTKTTYEDSVQVMNVNYYSILTIQEHMFPILKDNARVVNISSDCGHISNLQNRYWINRLTKKDLKLEDVNAFVEWFLDSVKNGTVNSEDFTETPLLAYRISKIALCALTRIQQKEVGRGISINSLHPGFTQTSMTKTAGSITVDEAIQTPVYLALDIDQSVKGKYFWFDKTEKDWTDPNLKLYCMYSTIEKSLKDANLI
ncbi:carbonyl reductase [NADPH] 3-like [Maniola hyperantus]|uniref:carbonyl reductase [NADPH] 3-like n=1 Tax=Aphantopus hyperantus TaxID=2795564 RepID=UPI00156A2930|nr:carbonyl reductase [NADPH] 3-like [Maniola hyperantus]